MQRPPLQISPGRQQVSPQHWLPAWQNRPPPQQAAPAGAQLPSAQVTGHLPVQAGLAAAGPTHLPSTQISPGRQQASGPQQVPLAQIRPPPQQLPPSGMQAPSGQGIGRDGSVQVTVAPGTQRPATQASISEQQAEVPQQVPVRQKRPPPQQLAPAGAQLPSGQACGWSAGQRTSASQRPSAVQRSPGAQQPSPQQAPWAQWPPVSQQSAPAGAQLPSGQARGRCGGQETGTGSTSGSIPVGPSGMARGQPAARPTARRRTKGARRRCTEGSPGRNGRSGS